MGNTSLNPVPDLMKEYEYNTGQKLLRAIKANSRSQMKDCLDLVKEEIRSQNKTSRLAHDKDYELMMKKVALYFTRGYDVGDGVIFMKTPLQYAELLQADQAIAFLNDTLAELSRNETASKVMEDKKAVVVKEQSFMGKVDRDRVSQAKDRLKAFQNERNTQKK